MNRAKWLIVAGVAVLAIAPYPDVRAQMEGMEGMKMPESRVDKVSKYDYKTTLSRLEKAVKAKGFMIVAKINHQNMISMVGVKMGGSFTLEFGKPEMMKEMLPMNPAIGLEMPLKVYVFEAGGKTTVSYHKPSAIFGAYGMAQMAEMMDKTLDMVTKEATE